MVLSPGSTSPGGRFRRLHLPVLAAGLVLLAAFRGPAPERIEAGNFVVVNEDGRELARIGLDQGGSPVLELRDPATGETVWRVSTREDEAAGLADASFRPLQPALDPTEVREIVGSRRRGLVDLSEDERRALWEAFRRVREEAARLAREEHPISPYLGRAELEQLLLDEARRAAELRREGERRLLLEHELTPAELQVLLQEAAARGW